MKGVKRPTARLVALAGIVALSALLFLAGCGAEPPLPADSATTITAPPPSTGGPSSTSSAVPGPQPSAVATPSSTTSPAAPPSTAAGSPGFVLPPDMPGDFGFVAAYGVGMRNLLDTFVGSFTKDLMSAGTISTHLALSAAELADMYQDLRRLDITAYPGQFDPPHEGLSHDPYESYYLRLRVAGQEKEIYWEDQHDSTAPQAVALRGLFKKIQRLIQAKPEYQALPAAEGGYA